MHIISDNNLSTLTSCSLFYHVLLVDLIFDLCLLLGLKIKHHRCGCTALRNAELIVFNKLWLIRINMVIDNDKSPLIRINLNFPARSGTFRQPYICHS